MNDSLFDKIFRDNEGTIVIAQLPNLPITVWLIAALLKLVFKNGIVYSLLDTIAFGVLFTWAWEELFQGVDYFRQALGLVVLVGAIWMRIQSKSSPNFE
jgi:hypothetical protein